MSHAKRGDSNSSRLKRLDWRKMELPARSRAHFKQLFAQASRDRLFLSGQRSVFAPEGACVAWCSRPAQTSMIQFDVCTILPCALFSCLGVGGVAAWAATAIVCFVTSEAVRQLSMSLIVFSRVPLLNDWSYEYQPI